LRKALWVSAGVVAVCLVWGIGEEVRHAGRVWPGVWVGGQPAGGLTPEELRARLQALAERRARQPVTVRAGRLRWAVTAGRLGLRVEGEEAVQAAYWVGRGRELGRRLRERWDLLRGPVSVQVRTSVDGPRLAAFLDEVSKAVHAPPREGRLVVRSGRVEVLPHRDGVRLDRAEAERVLRAALLASTREVELPLKPLRPVWTTERLRALGISRQVASFSTYFPPDPDRAHNIALAASRLRGLLLPTGSELSFNEAVGPRTARAGYREAPVLLDDELVPGDGGGVCQVSTTLFNAALLAGLAVRSRTNHSQPVPYVPVGRDATVVYGSVDLRVRNDGPPVLLWTQVAGQRLEVAFYGPPGPRGTVRVLVPEVQILPPPPGVVVRRDPRLAAGELQVVAPRPGFRATTVREVWEGGVLVRREVVARSWYRPVPRTVKVGVRKAAEIEVFTPGRP